LDSVSIEHEGYLFGSLDSTPTRQPELTTPAPLSLGSLATSHTYHLDVVASQATAYKRDGVELPAGATMILVIQPAVTR
jgi:hypothetical protein